MCIFCGFIRYPPELMMRVSAMAEKMDLIDDPDDDEPKKESKPKAKVILPEDNAGFKLMQKMGWQGSGLGRDCQGITVPLEAVRKHARHGLGRQPQDGRSAEQRESLDMNGKGERKRGHGGVQIGNTVNGKKSKGGKKEIPVVKGCRQVDERCMGEPLDSSMAAEISRVLGKYVNVECAIDNAIGSLHASARLNQKTLRFEHVCLSPKEHEVVVYLQDLLIGKAVADSQKEAKRAAATQGLVLLKTLYPTVVKKSLYTCSEEFKDDEVKVHHIIPGAEEGKIVVPEPSEPEEPDYVLPDHNAGFKLLQKMGWKGAGLGKDNQGRTAPVIPEILPKRAGLGIDLDKHKDDQGNIVTRDMDRMVIYQLLQEVSMGERELLTFSKSLSKGERAKIHQMCQKLGLRSQSIGKGEDRRLTVRCKMSKKQLHAMAQGGSRLFELEAPGSWQN